MRDLDIRGAGNVLGAEQSGFIADIGFDMFLKILDEAVEELKSEEFKDVFEQDENYEMDTRFDSDLRLMLPDDYVNNVTERLDLYKKLSEAKTEDDLRQFEAHLKDRFGPLPKEATDLIESVRLKWIAGRLGFEKLVLKMDTLIGYFVNDPKSGYFNSDLFGSILDFIRQYSSRAVLKDKNGKLTLVFKEINSLRKAIDVLGEIYRFSS